MNILTTSLRNYLCLALALSLSGCATLESPFDRTAQAPRNQRLSSTERSAQLSRLDSWKASGSVGITYRGKTDIGTFVWQQEGLNYDFRTYGPLNSASIRIAGRPGFATLWKNANTTRSAASPEALMRQEMGWFLPLSNLRFWSRGLAAPGLKGQTRYDQFGHLAFLEQQGWAISYQRYQAVGDKDLPRNVLMSRGDLRVKIVFKQW
jgi:outer membrane lipoprotein LolB